MAMTLAGTEVHNPLPQTQNNFAEGKVLFMHFCSPCHGETGQGDGLVVKHGYPPPPSYSKAQSSRGGAMKDLTDGKIYHTITYGVNADGFIRIAIIARGTLEGNYVRSPFTNFIRIRTE
jgi:cytochrome c